MGKVNKARVLKQKLAKRVDASKRTVTSITSKVSFKAKEKSSDKKLLLAQTPSEKPKKPKNKKEKFLAKHKNLLTKFAQQKKQKKEEIAQKNREKTAVVGDMKKLKDALPSLNELFKLSRENIKTSVQLAESEKTKKLNTKDKIKKNKKQFINRVSSLQALLKDPDFKKNPRDAIAYHIKYTNGLIE